jgi:uncharacterized delta-60 repeat protein
VRRARHAALIAALALGAVASPAYALLPGDLDPGFSGDGKAVTNLTTGYDAAGGIGVQADGKVVAAGSAAGGGGRFAIVRYTSGGVLDPSFHGDGRVFTNLTTGLDAAFDMALDANENVVAVGRAGGGGGRFVVARYRPTGQLDPAFGRGDGKVITNFTRGDDFAFGVAIQADGKIVAAGRAAGSGGVMAIARYRPDGTLDPTFGNGDGKVTTNFTRGDDRADAVAIQADMDIVVAGTANYFGLNGRFALARYTEAGVPDTTFSADGRLTTDFTAGFDGAFAVAVQADQHIVAAGLAGRDLGLARYDPSGALDPTFSGNGKQTTSFTAGADYADDIAVDESGRIVAAGAARFYGPNSRFAVARYEADGNLDPTFGGDGKVTTDFTTGYDGAYGVALTPDAKIVAGGYAAGGGGRFAVARYVGG